MENQQNHIVQQDNLHTIKIPINIFTISDLKTYIKLKYRTYKEAGLPVGLSECRVKHIVNGINVPKTPKLIHQIAEGWDVDPIKLTLIFSNCDNKISRGNENATRTSNEATEPGNE